MRCRLAALGAAYVHGAGLEGDRRPLQVAELRHAQTMPEADQDHRRVTLTMVILAARANWFGCLLSYFTAETPTPEQAMINCPLMGWSGPAPAPPAIKAGKGRQGRGARHVSES